MMTFKEVIGKISLLRSYVSEDGVELLNDIQDWIMSFSNETKKNRDWTSIAKKMIEVYHNAGCKGRWPFAPNTHWTCSEQIIANRLQSPKIDLSKFTDEQIIEATRKYIDVPVKDYKRTLMYFIWKNDNGELKSDLLTYLEDNDSNDEQQLDWLYN